MNVPGAGIDSHQAEEQNSVPSKPLPVTLLSGFLGSGKTTLLNQILAGDHGLRIAIIVNDIGAINVDANLITQFNARLTQAEEKVIALQNGCICCTLRGDLLEELVNLADLGRFDYVIIESSGISEPQQVAETFDTAFSQAMMDIDGEAENSVEGLDDGMKSALKRIIESGGLNKFAFLDTTVTVIDAHTILDDFQTDQLISETRKDVPDEDERTISDLMVDQIEFADVILLNKIDMVSKKNRETIRSFLSDLNHRAQIHEASLAKNKFDVKALMNTGRFDMDAATTGAGWLRDLNAMTMREINGKKKITPKPETEEYNVRNFVYVRPRPFHPRRLYELVYDKFILQEFVPGAEIEYEDDEDDDEDDDENNEDDDGDAESSDDDEEQEEEEELPVPSNREILANKSNHPLLAKLLRSKGIYFLATRPDRQGNWSQAGAMLTLIGGEEWLCLRSPEDIKTDDLTMSEMIAHDLKRNGKWGDRCTEMALIGEDLDIPGLEAMLDKCLLTDDEFQEWENIMMAPLSDKGREQCLLNAFDDGFPEWIPLLEQDHEHDHEDTEHDIPEVS